MFRFSKTQIVQLLSGIFKGHITPRKLPERLYLAIADFLKDGTYKGYGTTLFELRQKLADGIKGKFNQKDLVLLGDLRANIYMFSAAKTHAQLKEMTAALVADDGKLKPFADFKKDATQIFGKYNESYLKTEYDTAYGQAQMASKWRRIEDEADVLPYLKYDAVLDKNTSDICRPLDGITAPVNDPIWKKITPLNHFNCRCVLLQLDDINKPKLTSEKTKASRTKKAEDQMQDVFKMNAGQDGYIFSPKHPYFQVAPNEKAFAKKNFGLKIPKND